MSWFRLTLLSLLLASCGFHLRGETKLPIESLSISGSPSLSHALKRAIESSSKTKIVTEKAQYQLQIVNDTKEKVILSLNAAGRVREYELRYLVAFRVLDAKGVEVIARSEIPLSRVMNYDDTQVLAKESEEALYYRDMQGDVISQILRRLSKVKPDDAP